MEKNKSIIEKQDIVIVLNPENDIHTTDFTKNNIVHQLELKQVHQIIEKLIEAGKGYDPDKKPLRVHNTITLSGTRGSGKTSFLYSLFNEINKSETVLTLKIIDPTLIEEKGHIFLNIVARIKEKIDTAIDSKDIELGGDKYNQWNKCLNELAAGLPMLDGINGGLDPSDWNDTTFVMKDGLRRITGANNLELFFHKYVKQSLELLDRKYLLIAFDDVDTDFAKGWPVLETLRKYLTSPQIITILSGDLDLYSFVVRKKQWKNFGKALLMNEYEKDTTYTNEYSELVEKLESQYMLKLLKPEYRITLSTLASKLASNSIKIYLNNQEVANQISQKYSLYVEKSWGVNGNNMKEQYVKFFTSFPLRSQLSLLNSFSIINLNQNDSQKLHQITKGIFDVFYSELRTANVDIWEMINGYGLTNIYLLKFLLDNKILDEASQFFPKLNNPSLDGAVVAMGAVLSERVSLNPVEIFDYIIRISNIVSKADKWPLEAENNHPNIQSFVSHSRSLLDYGLRKTASLQSAYITSFENTPKNEGLIPIRTLNKRSKDARDENDLRLDEIFDNHNLLNKYIGTMPAVGIQDNKGGNSTFYSFFNIIASIGDIILQDGVDNMKEEFLRMAQFRTFPLYFNANQRFDFGNKDAEEEDDTLILSDELNARIMSLVQKIANWKDSWNGKIVPPYILGRIMVRTIYAFPDIELKSDMKVSDLLHRQIIAFLNAIFVEEVMENQGNAKLRLSNPRNSDQNFIDNFKSNANNHPLFDFIFNCPLIQSYLNPKLFDEIEIDRPEINIFQQLSNLNIKGITEVKDTITIHNQNVKGTITQLNRYVKDTKEDADILIKYFKSKNVPKEQIDFNRVKKSIPSLFKNERVATEMANKLLKRIQVSNLW